MKPLNNLLSKKNITRIVMLALFPLSLFITNIAQNNAFYVEKYYSSSIYPVIASGLSIITSMAGFSVAEIIIILSPFVLIGFAVIKAVSFIRTKITIKDFIKAAALFIVNVLCGLSLLYFLFISLWGLNYYRPALKELAGFDTSEITVAELGATCEYLAENMNLVRDTLSEDENGVVKSNKSLTEILSGSKEGFANLHKDYGAFIKFIPRKAKPVVLSVPMSYLGISGIYIPHTAEPNVNVCISPYMLQSTFSHEQAHQLGFAREEEANFISFLACVSSPDPEFVYSGYMLAFIHSSNALYRVDTENYKLIMDSLSDSVYADLKHNRDFWKRYEGPVSEASNKANDSYLRSNGQTEGVKSYGAMVDLVVGYLRGIST